MQKLCLLGILLVGSCVTVSGPRSGVPCVFPFTYNGIEYNEPIPHVVDGGKPWCATRITSTGEMETDEWGYCKVRHQVLIRRGVSFCRHST